MKAEHKKYLRKRQQIADIICAIRVDYEDWREEIYTSSNPGVTEAYEAAEKILAKLGINKPKDLEK